MRPLKARTLSDAAHVALLFPQQMLEVDSFEGFARLAQRQLEKPRGNFRRERRSGGSMTAPTERLASRPASNRPSAARLPSCSLLVQTSTVLCFSSLGSRNERPFCSALV